MSRMDDFNFHRDSRTWNVASAYRVVSSGPRQTVVRLSDACLESLVDDEVLPEDHDGEFTLSTKFSVCGQCEGSGTMVNPSIDAGGLSQEVFDDDPDFAEDYWSGAFDVTCNRCKGQRVVPEVRFPKDVQEAVQRWEQSEWNFAAERAAERAMGA